MTTNASVPFRTWWRRLGAIIISAYRWACRAFAPPTHGQPAPPGQLTLHTDLTAPIVVPARGYVFHFQIHAVFHWKADGLSWPELQSNIRQWTPLAIRELRRRIGSRSRDFEPHRADELEKKIHELLAGLGEWRFGPVVTCRPRVWVQLDDRVRQQIQPLWEKRIAMECEHEMNMRRTALADELSQEWVTVLDRLLVSPIADGAAKLTEQQLSEVISDLVARRQEVTEKFEDLVRNSDQMGGFEQAEAHDALIAHLRTQVHRPHQGANGRARTAPADPQS